MIIRILAVFVLLMASAVWAVLPAAACTCATGDPEERLESADAALVGRVVSRSPLGGPISDPLVGYMFTFEPETVVKGDIGGSAIEFSFPYGSQCGMGLGGPDGERAGVFLRLNYQGDYEGYACSGIDPDVLASLAQHDETTVTTSPQHPPGDAGITGDTVTTSDSQTQPSENLAPVAEEAGNGQGIAMWSAVSIAGLTALSIGYAVLRKLNSRSLDTP